MSIYWYPGKYFEYNIAICSRASNLRITLQLISHSALSWIIFVGKYIHSANLKHSENKASRAQILLADFEPITIFIHCFLSLQTLDVLLFLYIAGCVEAFKWIWGFDYCGLQKKNKLKERHVEDGGIGGGGGGRNNEAFIPECALKMVQVKDPAIWEQGLLPLLRT